MYRDTEAHYPLHSTADADWRRQFGTVFVLPESKSLVVKHPGHPDQSVHGSWARGGYETGEMQGKSGIWMSRNGAVAIRVEDDAQPLLEKTFSQPVTHDMLARMYTQGLEQLGLGYNVRIDVGTTKINQQDAVVVSGRIYDEQGNVRGYFARHISTFKDVDGKIKPLVDNSSFSMFEEKQGTGFGAEFILGAEAQYRKMGVAAVTVSAQDVGSYAWAVMGFSFTEQSDRDHMQHEMEAPKMMISSFVSKADPHLSAAERAVVVSRLQAQYHEACSNAKEPWEFAAIEIEHNGQRLPAGRMMAYNSWDGIKYLDNRGFQNKKVGEAYLRSAREKREQKMTPVPDWTKDVDSDAVRGQFIRLKNEFDDNLSFEQTRALNNYTGSGFTDINTALRQAAADPSYDYLGNNVPSDVQERIRDLDDAFATKGYPIEKDTALYRGVVWDSDQDEENPTPVSMRETFENLRPGDVITEPGYSSTSASRRVAANVSGGNDPILRIQVPAQTRVLIGTVHEREFIMPRGSRFRFVGKSRSPEGGRDIYHMELLP